MVSARPRSLSMVDTELAQLSFPGPRHCRKPTSSKVNNFLRVIAYHPFRWVTARRKSVVLAFVGIEKHAHTCRLDSVCMATEEKAENNEDCQKDSSAVTYSCFVFHFIGRFVQETSGAAPNLIYV